jgi:Zn-dependent M28 family amino/carboxypeptidase
METKMKRGAISLCERSVLMASSGLVFACTAVADEAVEPLVSRVQFDVQRAQVHLRALQSVADGNQGTRVSGTSGYDQSANYVVAELERSGYAVARLPFEFAFFQELSPPVLEQLEPASVAYPPDDPAGVFGMTYSPSGDVSGLVQGVDLALPPPPAANSSSSGCESEDFAAFVPGNIALVQRGTCSFLDKARNAELAGASAVIVFNEGQPGRTEAAGGTLFEPVLTIPVVSVSFDVGAELAALPMARVHLASNNLSETRTTENIIADSACGNAAETIVVGAHLDSVPEGPGINDNGSGSAALLEIAAQLSEASSQAEDCPLASRVRFAFWGAEEFGGVGSDRYVASLAAEELERIALNLNFDMLGSPNFVRFIYDGDGSETPVAGPPGSDQIEGVFAEYFAARGLPTQVIALDGRSDYAGFMERGIPVGGLFSGAEAIKTEEQAALFGGTAGVALDACYHEVCDTLENVSEQALGELGGAALYAVAVLGARAEPVLPVPEPSLSAEPVAAAPLARPAASAVVLQARSASGR